MLGGVLVPCAFTFVAHSDGDVLLHALCDALLGAGAAGDLGEHFPDTDAAHANRASCEFVHAVLALPALAGWTINNIDCNVIAQSPRLSAHKTAIREKIASLLGINLEQVSVKARTNEKLDAIGHEQAIAAQVIVQLEKIAT